jgi:hypothetical protein
LSQKSADDGGADHQPGGEQQHHREDAAQQPALPCATACRLPKPRTSSGAATSPAPTLNSPEKKPLTTPTPGNQRSCQTLAGSTAGAEQADGVCVEFLEDWLGQAE